MRFGKLLAAAGGVALLAACGGGSTAPTVSSPAAGSAPASAPAKPAASASTAAKPAASTAASALAKPAASGAGSAKPAASGSAGASAAAKPSVSFAPNTCPGGVGGPPAVPKPSGAPPAAPKPTAAPPSPRVAADTTNVPQTKMVIPGTEGQAISFDILWIDQPSHTLYLTDHASCGLDVVDVSAPTPKFVKTVKTPAPTNGVVQAGKTVVTGLSDGSVANIDPGSGQIVGTVKTAGKYRADELDYDAKTNKVYIGSSNDGLVSVIDMAAFKIIKTFDNLGDGIEQPRIDPTNGTMFVTTGNGLVSFDPAKDTLLKTDTDVKGCSGMNINPKTQQGLIMCNPNVVVYDFGAGKKLGELGMQACAGDGSAYSAALDIYVLPGGNCVRWGPTQTIAGGTPIKFITNVPVTAPVYPGAGRIAATAAIDDTNKMSYYLATDGLYYFAIPTKPAS